jgi:hypothetical protein
MIDPQTLPERFIEMHVNPEDGEPYKRCAMSVTACSNSAPFIRPSTA